MCLHAPSPFLSFTNFDDSIEPTSGLPHLEYETLHLSVFNPQAQRSGLDPMLNQNDYVKPRTGFLMPDTWKKVMREADALARRRVEDEAPPLDAQRLQRRNERMAAFPQSLPADSIGSGGGGGFGLRRSNSPKQRKDYGQSQFPDSRGYFSGNEESDGVGYGGGDTSDGHGYRNRKGVRTPSTWRPPGSMTTPVSPTQRPLSPRLQHGQPTAKALASAHGPRPMHAAGPGPSSPGQGFVPREIPPAAGRSRVSVGGSPVEIPVVPAPTVRR